MSVLSVKNLTKTFGKFTAVNGISFQLEEGEILGFLGPNGAGKTTTLQMLIGSLTPTEGEIEYFGKSLFRHREEILDQVNYSTTYTNLPWNLSVRENLNFISFLYNIPNRKKRLEKIIESFKLADFLSKRVGDLSAGQKTRINLAKAFLNYPKVLLLDEPTASLDPDVAKYIRDYLLEERKEYKVSMLFTSHNMKEVEEVCDRVVFINNGTVIANGTPLQLARKIDTTQVELLPKDQKKILAFCKEKNISHEINKKYVTLMIKESEVPNMLHNLSENNIHYEEISINKPTLEDYFLKISLQKQV